MKSIVLFPALLLIVFASVTTGLAAEAKAGRGETLFREKCAVCHPDGNNSINDKTLKRKDLVKVNLNSRDAIIKTSTFLL
jgi:mono/diheme cytochrome c family protein